MKRHFYMLLGLMLLCCMSLFAGSSNISWNSNYKDAVVEAGKNNKPILLFFTGSDWCKWCQKMQEEVFASSDFVSEVGDKFIFVEVDFPMNKELPKDQKEQNDQLRKKYNINSFPTIIVLSSRGDFLAESGYQYGGGKKYSEYLKQFLK